MEGDEMLELLEKAVVVVEERQDKLKKLDEAIWFSSGPRRDQVIQPRIDLRGRSYRSMGSRPTPCAVSSYTSTTRSPRSTRCSTLCDAHDASHAPGGSIRAPDEGLDTYSTEVSN